MVPSSTGPSFGQGGCLRELGRVHQKLLLMSSCNGLSQLLAVEFGNSVLVFIFWVNNYILQH